MILAACTDDRFGMSFGGRRQSKDAAVRRRLWELSGGNLRMSEYSSRQFDKPVYSGADYLSGAREVDWCFAEDLAFEAFAGSIGQIVLFRWNRHYPTDVQFRFPGKWALVRTEDFPGSSHETITMEVYEKCE